MDKLTNGLLEVVISTLVKGKKIEPLITLPAHFDDNSIVLDSPFKLQSNEKLLITVIRTSSEEAEKNEWIISSLLQLNKTYSEYEPEYSLSSVKESNPEYNK